MKCLKPLSFNLLQFIIFLIQKHSILIFKSLKYLFVYFNDQKITKKYLNSNLFLQTPGNWTWKDEWFIIITEDIVVLFSINLFIRSFSYENNKKNS